MRILTNQPVDVLDLTSAERQALAAYVRKATASLDAREDRAEIDRAKFLRDAERAFLLRMVRR
jgi:hypothetical protein